jgi:hypothetical protein
MRTFADDGHIGAGVDEEHSHAAAVGCRDWSGRSSRQTPVTSFAEVWSEPFPI